MPVVYVANVGTRDLTRGGGLLARPRSEGESLLQQYENKLGTFIRL